MQTKVLVNYANKIFRESQTLNTKTGLEVGLFNEAISYSPKEIDKKFYKDHKEILNLKRGGGYYLWKPYFIKKTLEKMDWGNYLFYCDSGSYFIKPITPIIDICEATKQDIIVFELPNNVEKNWTKRDVFIALNCDSERFTESFQYLGGFSLWKKSNFAMDFIDELLGYSTQKQLITDVNNQYGLPNYDGFIEHRHDQSILSLLAKKYGITAYRDPSQYGNGFKQYYPNSKYEQLIGLTRKHKTSLSFKVKSEIKKIGTTILGKIKEVFK